MGLAARVGRDRLRVGQRGCPVGDSSVSGSCRRGNAFERGVEVVGER